MQPDLVSTIIPVHNRADMVREAVESALDQTYRPIEVIVIDDGSTDETALACDELASRHPEVRAIHQTNSGPGGAREAGRLVARGEFIQYLDSDDLLLPRKTEMEVAALQSHPEAGVAFCAVRHRFLDRPTEEKISGWSGEKVASIFPRIFKGRIWLTPAFMVRAAVSELAGPWTNLKQYEDWEYDVRLGLGGVAAVWCADVLAEVRHHSFSRAGAWLRLTADQLRERARAHVLIYGHARNAGLNSETPEMRHLARALFSYSRWCGAEGFTSDARELFDLSREASGSSGGRGLDFRLYRSLAAVVGWRSAGALSRLADHLRK